MVGTRGSTLALIQTGLVVRALQKGAPTARFDVQRIVTSGDRDRHTGGSPDFTDAIDRALLDGEVDLAVHSAKDVALDVPRRLQLGAFPRRADPRDCLVLRRRRGAGPLPRGARVGSSSRRRRAQLLRWRPDLRVVEIRGNVDSRIARVRAGDLDAVIVAVAGVRRLGRANEIGAILSAERFVPSPGQGSLAVAVRSGDRRTERLVRRIDHAATRAAVEAERAFARELGGDCNVPLGALARPRDGRLFLTGEVLSPDGRLRLRVEGPGSLRRARPNGEALGRRALQLGARGILSRAT